MSVLIRNHWLKNLAVILVSVLTMGGVTLQSTPAEARVFVGVGIPFGGWGYYAPAPYYPYGYYGYPSYVYPGGFFIGGTFGPRFRHHYHHWR